MWIKSVGKILNMSHVEYLTTERTLVTIGEREVPYISLYAYISGNAKPIPLNSSEENARGIDYINACLDEIYHAIEQGKDFFDVKTVPYEVQY